MPLPNEVEEYLIRKGAISEPKASTFVEGMSLLFTRKRQWHLADACDLRERDLCRVEPQSIFHCSTIPNDYL